MTGSSRLVWIFIFALLTGCSAVQVSQDYLPETQFYDLKTYQWQSEEQKPSGNKDIDNPLLVKRIRGAIEQVLTEKGYRKTTEGSPDFYVSYNYDLNSKIESNDTGAGFSFGFGSRSRFGGIGINSGREIREYNQATMLIDLVNAKTKDLIWRGKGTRRIPDHSTPAKTTETVNEIVAKILYQFPPLP